MTPPDILPVNRLPLELDRLYGLGPGPRAAAFGPGLRAAVLSLVLPAGWEPLSSVWRGVQSDLELPAPAIAVSGEDALQLWFSFAAPPAPPAAARFLQGLRERYLPDVKPAHVRLFSDAAGFPAAPGVEVGAERWSAFVTPDLAAVFAETPWLDTPPGDEGQAAILRGIQPMREVAFEAALKRLGATEPSPPQVPQDSDPARFLSGVMNDDTAPLALRIEAAAILLSHAGRG